MISKPSTPALLLDNEKLRANVDRMVQSLEGSGVRFRAHFKTAKSVEVAKLLADRHGPRFTVSTLAEAAALVENGYRDVLYAVGIVPGKLDAVVQLRKAGSDLTIVLDNVAAARAVASHGQESGIAHRVMIEIDTDGHRAGIQPDDAALTEIAGALEGCELVGVMTHAGDSYLARSQAAIRTYAKQEAEGAVHAAERLRTAGHPSPVVSVGSSPTVRFVEPTRGVTELRAGVYMFGDLFMAGLGVCKVEDIAISCLVTVVGHQRGRNWILTDGGWTAISQDRSTAALSHDCHYGLVCDEHGELLNGLHVLRANQEHGIVGRPDGGPLPEIPYGTRLRILPNHACAMASHHEAYHVLGTGEVWPRVRGWMPGDRTLVGAFA